MKKILMPDHHDLEWQEFVCRMFRMLGRPEDRRCRNDLRFASLALDEMGLDVERSLEQLRSRGGHCDCEVILNVVYDEAGM